MDEEQEQRERQRPRVVDKRSSRGGTSSSPGAPDAPAAAPAPPAEEGPAPPAPAEPVPSEPTPTASAAAEPPSPPPPEARDGEQAREQVWTPEQEAEAQRMAQEIAGTPSLEWVVNAAVTFANVAATKLELGSPQDAQLAIDALGGLLKTVGPRLGEAEAPLRQTLAQLQMAFAERIAQPPPTV